MSYARQIDAPTRILHWLIAISFLGAFVTRESDALRGVHIYCGYTLIAMVILRIIWSLIGSKQASLTLPLHRAKNALKQLSAIKQPTQRLRIVQGLNSLVTLAMLAISFPLVMIGYLMINDYVGHDVGEIHELLGNLFLLIVLTHLALLVVVSVFTKRFAGKAMLTGRGYTEGKDLVEKNNSFLAVLIVLIVGSFWGWQAYTNPKALYDPTAKHCEDCPEHQDDDEHEHHEHQHHEEN